MERGSVDDAGVGQAGVGRPWADRVEARQPVALDARQVDQMVGSLGHCVSAVYAMLEAFQADSGSGQRRRFVTEAYRSIEEASELLDTLTTDLTKRDRRVGD